MKVKVLTFGIAKEIVGARQVMVEVSLGATTADLRKLLEEQYPELHALATYMVAVNNQYANSDTPITEGDEIAIIPPVSGG